MQTYGFFFLNKTVIQHFLNYESWIRQHTRVCTCHCMHFLRRTCSLSLSLSLDCWLTQGQLFLKRYLFLWPCHQRPWTENLVTKAEDNKSNMSLGNVWIRSYCFRILSSLLHSVCHDYWAQTVDILRKMWRPKFSHYRMIRNDSLENA